MSRAEYLQKYLTKDDTRKKAKKRKRKEDTGVIIADDDALGWDDKRENDDEDDPVTIGETTRAFRRTKKSNWTSVDADSSTADADAIVTANQPPENPEDRPALVERDDASSAQKMSSGAHAGLQTAAQVKAQLERQRRSEAALFASQDPAITGIGQETIYRDASGRIINVAMARAEARKKLEEDALERRKIEEHLKGEVQVVRAEERRKELEDIRYAPLARYADDKEMNEELRERERWNDPAMAFLSGKKEGVSITGRPVYKGPAAPPNRFGIKPGHRWDGVDRGNGWEKKWFQAQNNRRNRAQVEFDMEIDV